MTAKNNAVINYKVSWVRVARNWGRLEVVGPTELGFLWRGKAEEDGP